jgi:sulfatase maturation enzyme AslB (radical SAM superfamily)
MHYLKPHEIKYLQIDHNSSCNLRCPQCARTHEGNTIPGLPNKQLNVEHYKEFILGAPNLNFIMWCGNYGEVIVSDTFLECLQYVVENTTAKLVIATNSSARDESWWKELGLLLKGRGKVNFSIDGLEDTNHLYRVNANFDKCMRNAQAFIDAGGIARWDYLVFGHNEHQVDDAILKAKQMGFRDFAIKLTNRFVNDEQYTNKKSGAENQNVITRKSKYTLEMPRDESMIGSGKNQNQLIMEKYGNWKNYVDQTPISCKWKPNGQIFLDFENRVWPCTWTASGYLHYGENTQKTQANQLFDLYGKDFNNLDKYSLAEVLEHDYFAHDFCKSWEGTQDSTVPKLFACGRTCGTDYNFSSAHGTNRRILELQNV